MELATALHHSAQTARPVVEEPIEEAGREQLRLTRTEASASRDAAGSLAGSSAAVGGRQSRSVAWLPRFLSMGFRVSRAMTASVAVPSVSFSSRCFGIQDREATVREEKEDNRKKKKRRKKRLPRCSPVPRSVSGCRLRGTRYVVSSGRRLPDTLHSARCLVRQWSQEALGRISHIFCVLVVLALFSPGRVDIVSSCLLHLAVSRPGALAPAHGGVWKNSTHFLREGDVTRTWQAGHCSTRT